MDILAFITLTVTGFTSGAEFGSYAFVHPVIRYLPLEHHIRVEQGLLKTFGRVMPVLMTLCVFLSVSCAINLNSVDGVARFARWASAASFIVALVSTIIFNVPINLATGRCDVSSPPEKWQETRNHWEFFQGLRSWLLLIGFVLLCLAATLYS
jgi:hypothetical protein